MIILLFKLLQLRLQQMRVCQKLLQTQEIKLHL
nr:MAG TPA: hypothetical protein [Caudoviricetes sp.]